MQSPLTPQRGRIESNPREYTHMGPRPCGELAVMPMGIDASWPSSEREWIFGRNQPQNAQKPSKYPPSFPDRPKSTLIRRPHISHLSLISNTRDNRKTRDKYER